MSYPTAKKSLGDVLSLVSRKDASDGELLTVAFTASGLSWSWLETHGATPKILGFSKLRLDPTMSENDRRNACLGFLNSLKSKKYPRVAVSWSENMAFRQLNLPDMPQSDLLKAFEWELKKKYYYEAKENHFGYVPVMTIEGAEGPEKLFNVFYCDKKTAALSLNFIQELGLEVRSLMASQAALAAFAGQVEPTPENDVLICELDETLVRILIVRENRNMLTRQVSLGAHETNVTDVFLGKVCEEIKRTIDFYESQVFSRPVAKVLLLANTEEAERAHQFITQHIDTKVVTPSLETYLADALSAEDKERLLKAPGIVAAGLGSFFQRDESLNMVPEDIKNVNRQRRWKRLMNLALAASGLILGLILVGMSTHIHIVKGSTTALKKDLNFLLQKKQEFEEVLGKEKIRRVVYYGTIYFPSLLKELSHRTPSVISITEMEYDKEAGTVMIRGEVNDNRRDNSKSVTQFAANLSESPYFMAVEVAGTSQDDEKKMLLFEIRCTVKGLQ